MIHRLAFTSLLFFINLFLFGSELVVHVEAPTYKGKQAQLIRFSDYFTFTPQLLSAARIAEDGTVEFKGQCEGPELAMLRIDHVNAYVYLSPNAQLQVVFPPLPENTARTIANTNFVELSFVDLPAEDPNAQLSLLNQRIDEFYNQHMAMHRVEDQKAAGLQQETPVDSTSATSKFDLKGEIDKLETELDKQFENSAPFVQQEKEYAVAMLYWNANVTRKWLYERYFKDQQVQLSSPTWVDLFRSYFQEHFMLGPMFGEEVAFRKALELDQDPAATLQLLLQHQFVRDSLVAELLLLNGIYEYYHSQHFNRAALREVLRKMTDGATTSDLQAMAGSMLTDLTSLEQGGRAPDFSLLDNKRGSVNLNHFEGQYLYLGFWASWCSSCMKELKVMRLRHEEYGEHVAFLTINIDDDLYARAEALETLDLPWADLYHANDPLVLDRYDIRSVPQFFLIGPDGKMLDPMAARPSAGIAAQLHKIKVAAEKQEKVKVWDD